MSDWAELIARLEAAQYALDQMSDDPQPGGWNEACEHICNGIRTLKDKP